MRRTFGLSLAAVVLAAGCKDKQPAEPQSAPAANPSNRASPDPVPEFTTTEDTVPSSPAPGARADGLIIEALVVGTGAECPRGATVTIHYKGTLTNGREFDSSYGRGRPATFPLDDLIAGWQEGIPGMKVGGKRKLTIPYQLGYGAAGSPPDIPPKATLVFEIELLGVKK